MSIICCSLYLYSMIVCTYIFILLFSLSLWFSRQDPRLKAQGSYVWYSRTRTATHYLCTGYLFITCVLEIFFILIFIQFKLRLRPQKYYFPQHTPTDCMVRRNFQDGKHLNKILLMLVFVIVLLILLLFVHIARDRRVRSSLLLSCVSPE